MKGLKEGLLRARESEVAFGGVGSAFFMSKKKDFNFRGNTPTQTPLTFDFVII